jgi:hypothetical protein
MIRCAQHCHNLKAIYFLKILFMIKVSWCSGGWPELCARFGPETACLEKVVGSIPSKCNSLSASFMCCVVLFAIVIFMLQTPLLLL